MKKVLAINLAVISVIGVTALALDNEPLLRQRTIKFEGKEWKHSAVGEVTAEKYREKMALCLYEGGDKNFVYLPDIEFQNGTIEVDIAAFGRSLPGIGFRGCDEGSWRNKIVFNRWRGIQATPYDVVQQAVVTHKIGTVLLLNIERSEQEDTHQSPGVCEWFHVKIVIQGSNMKVHLNGREEPSIEVGAMFDENEKGVIGLCGGDCGFANFRYTPAE
ncbi:MAG: hypothetical protein ACYC0X_13460 [Pirellulaceae bacterium]